MLYIASDHGGFDLKKHLKECLREREIDCVDLGVESRDSVDYPDLAATLAHEVMNDKDNLGILICGTGIGMSIAANKFHGIRAALVHDEFTARMAREHNNANVLVLGGRVLNPALACKIVQIWLNSVYEGGRHQNRLDKISVLEHSLNEPE
ncbi:MAG: ribose 5-phosphate isomerase B [Desulfuromonadaceae bacterium]|nr:ribose 5-phosphate isomerase B [Desulfuromonadaceae bacterium]